MATETDSDGTWTITPAFGCVVRVLPADKATPAFQVKLAAIKAAVEATI
jgi:hypothetical protein